MGHLQSLAHQPSRSTRAMTTTTQDPASDVLSFPIGRFHRPASLDADARARAIEIIASTPARRRSPAPGLTTEQIQSPHRPGGWTVRQVLHHVPHSHMNAYIRFKSAPTENVPTIKPYEESEWAKLADTRLPL